MAGQWQAMVATANGDGVALLVISVFRSFDYQRGIIQRKLAEGKTLTQITRPARCRVTASIITGRAIDIGATGSEPLTEEFEKTTAFEWLTRRGREFGFSMTYPRDNSYGIMFEPWHWMFHPTTLEP